MLADCKNWCNFKEYAMARVFSTKGARFCVIFAPFKMNSYVPEPA
ncbi:hypothetical protein CLV59_1118 [Chitinophaga dinghuensis]|uniref:Uncharacterized protein n=1 Tax=Chitinophaga dinghuensis TaxID=1539050 RepID=A0A327VM48_9BACT|nr:hypothetical protein CLV59_1118 [Chitinophaga dinghuensis]